MALPSYSPREGVISGAEEQLSLAALDPAKAGMALPLLFGAQAVRQNSNYLYDQNNARDHLLATMAQNETARHQQASDTNTTLGLKAPGAIQLAANLPGTRSLFAGMLPEAVSLLNDITQRSRAADSASTVKDVNAAAYSGVQAGMRMPIGPYQQMTGFTPTVTAPEGEILEGMRQSGANTRNAANLLKQSEVVYGSSVDKEGNITHSASGVTAANAPETDANLLRMSGAKPTTYKNAEGQTEIVPAQPPLTRSVTTKNRRTGEVASQYNLPITPATGGSPTTSAPPTGTTPLSKVMVAPDQAANWSTVSPYAKEYFAWALGPSSTLSQQERDAVKANYSAGNFSLAQDRTGKKYLTMGGKVVSPVRQ